MIALSQKMFKEGMKEGEYEYTNYTLTVNGQGFVEEFYDK